MKCEKPMSEKLKENCNKIYFLFKRSDVLTKEQMCEHLGWEYNSSNDRRIREIVSLVAQKVPIVSTSDQKGYKLAKGMGDLESVEHQWAELSSRVEELNKRIEPLAKFRDKYKYNIGD